MTGLSSSRRHADPCTGLGGTERPSSGLLVEADDTAWGWFHLFLGVLVPVCGFDVHSGHPAARAVGVVLAVLSALVNLVYLEAYPVWGAIAITIDVLVIYALTVHGGELRGH